MIPPQVLTEADFLGVLPAASEAGALPVAREAFVEVMLRRRLYALDYDAFLERHPQEKFFP